MNSLYFTQIKKTDHYIEFHEQEVPWSEVIEVILTTKNKRKKGDKMEIETNKYYILCELKENTLYVLNAKRR